MSGRIKGSEYDSEFRQLLHHFQMGEKSIINFQGIEVFFQKYQLDHCQTAKQRIKEGQSGYKGEEADKGMALRVMTITEKMIGAIDILEIDFKQVDQLQPPVSEILNALK